MPSNGADIGQRSAELEQLVITWQWEDTQPLKRTLDFAREFQTDRQQEYRAVVLANKHVNIIRERKARRLKKEEYEEKFEKLLFEILELRDEIIDANSGDGSW